jgi:hypothetical protein
VEMDGPVLVLYQTDRLNPQADGFAVAAIRAATRATHFCSGNDAYRIGATHFRGGRWRCLCGDVPLWRWMAPFWFCKMGSATQGRSRPFSAEGGRRPGVHAGLVKSPTTFRPRAVYGP